MTFLRDTGRTWSLARAVALALVGVVAGCGDDVVSGSETEATGSSDGSGSATQNTTASTSDATESDASGSGSEGTTAGSDPTMSTTASTNETTSGPTTDATSDASASTTSTTTTSTSGTSDGTTGDGVCEFPGTEVLSATLQDLDAPSGCGTLEFTGRVDVFGNGMWNMDGCPCGAQCLVPDPWLFTMDAPVGWLPDMPMCPRIVLHTSQAFDQSCELSGLAIWDIEQPNLPPLYIAGGTPPQLVEVNEVSVSSNLIETCSCEGCCGDDESHNLEFVAGQEQLTLNETEEGELFTGSVLYDVVNFQSHVTGLCDAGSGFYWAMKAE